MSRIIENPEEKLVEQALQLLRADGYAALTIRAVAAGCGVGVGTVYNYFPSKEDLIAAVLLSQWNGSVASFQAECSSADTPEQAVHAIYDQMYRFGREYSTIVSSTEAIAAFITPHGPYNSLLRNQFSLCLRRFCPSDFAADFISQTLLTETLSGHPFDAIWSMLQKLFQ